MTKPTEGPYKVRTDLFGAVHVYAPDGDRLTNDRMSGTENWPATARLLAKSWEMREALRKAELSLMPNVQGGTIDRENVLTEIRALLRSIEGE